MSSLYERLGGEAAVEAAVERFYGKIMQDGSVAPFFDGLDMGAMAKKQIAFMTMALGGPHEYSGQDLRTAHSRLVAHGLSDRHFDAVAAHLESALAELDVEPKLIGEVLSIVGSTRGDVLGR